VKFLLAILLFLVTKTAAAEAIVLHARGSYAGVNHYYIRTTSKSYDSSMNVYAGAICNDGVARADHIERVQYSDGSWHVWLLRNDHKVIDGKVMNK
jgi:hypothetical protein